MAGTLMQIILKAGGLSLRELLARAGTGELVMRQLANLIKSGDLSLAVRGADTDIPEAQQALQDLTSRPDSSEEQITASLKRIAHDPIAESIEVEPTLKAWRRPYSAA